VVRKNRCIALILIMLLTSFAFTTRIASAQDVQTDRHSIKVVLLSGNDIFYGGSENISSLITMINGTSPERGVGLNLTVSYALLSDADVSGAQLLILSMPYPSMIPNSTYIRHFVDAGGSLFLMSDYSGGGITNSSIVFDGILKEIGIDDVAFNNDTISISNSSSNWQSRVYGNNALAINVNNSMFQLAPSSEAITNGLTSVVTLACSLNITNRNDPVIVGNATAQSDSGLQNWLVLLDDGTHRSALCGSASMFNNTYINVENNRAVLRNIILWLVHNFQASPLDIFVYMALGSSAILVVGVVVYLIYWRRRTVA
jgi:hypothetical protein